MGAWPRASCDTAWTSGFCCHPTCARGCQKTTRGCSFSTSCVRWTCRASSACDRCEGDAGAPGTCDPADDGGAADVCVLDGQAVVTAHRAGHLRRRGVSCARGRPGRNPKHVDESAPVLDCGTGCWDIFVKVVAVLHAAVAAIRGNAVEDDGGQTQICASAWSALALRSVAAGATYEKTNILEQRLR